jgi:hypothetical protein
VLVDAAPGRGDDYIRLDPAHDMRQMRVGGVSAETPRTWRQRHDDPSRRPVGGIMPVIKDQITSLRRHNA